METDPCLTVELLNVFIVGRFVVTVCTGVFPSGLEKTNGKNKIHCDYGLQGDLGGCLVGQHANRNINFFKQNFQWENE